MTIEKAISILKNYLKEEKDFLKFVNIKEIECGEDCVNRSKAIETVLNYINNSIPKEVIEKKIKEAKQELKKEQEKAHWKNIAMLMKLDTKIEALQDLLEEK